MKVGKEIWYIIIYNTLMCIPADQDQDVPFAVLGPACSEATKIVASLNSQQYFGVVHVSFGALSPILSDTNHFTHFYRTVPSYSSYNNHILALMNYFDWQIIGIVHEVESFHTTALENLAELFMTKNSSANIQVSLDLQGHLGVNRDRIITSDVRVNIAMVSERNATATMCAAYLNGQTGPNFQWILLGEFIGGWWKTDSTQQAIPCTNEEMMSAVESVIIISNSIHVMSVEEQFSSITGQGQSEFWNEFERRLENNTGLTFKMAQTTRVLQSYDAVWSIARALNVTLAKGNFPRVENSSYNLESFTTPRVDKLHDTLNRNMKILTFNGTSGKIKYTSEINSQQNPTAIIYQMKSGEMVSVGIHYFSDDYQLNLSYFGNNFSWTGDREPRDRPIVIPKLVKLWLVCMMICLAVAGVVFAIIILVINFACRNHKVIKASSPNINILIIIGCVLGFFAIPIMSIENLDINASISPYAYLYICNARPWMLSLSLTLSFGSLFAKTFRVFMVFRNPWKKGRPLKDHRLAAMVFSSLVVDIVVLIVWSVAFPLELVTVLKPADDGKFVVYAYKMCLFEDLQNPVLVEFIAVVSIMKGCFFIGGMYLVVRTSNIKVKLFQESRFVGATIYFVVITCGIGVPVTQSLVFQLQVDLVYAFSMIVILLCGSCILGHIFVPRLILLIKEKQRTPAAGALRGKCSNGKSAIQNDSSFGTETKCQNSSSVTKGIKKSHTISTTRLL